MDKINLKTTVANLSVETFLKMVTSTMLSVNDQQSTQMSKQIGAMQSDLAGRFITQSDIDVGQAESLRATRARGYDTIGAASASHLHRGYTQFDRMVESSVNHYSTVLADERLAKAKIGYYDTAKIAQEIGHRDIAIEDQWESDKEALVAAIIGEVVKSIQVPPAATE